MTQRRQRDPKTEDLKRTGTLNPHAKSVTDPLSMALRRIEGSSLD